MIDKGGKYGDPIMKKLTNEELGVPSEDSLFRLIPFSSPEVKFSSFSSLLPHPKHTEAHESVQGDMEVSSL